MQSGQGAVLVNDPRNAVIVSVTVLNDWLQCRWKHAATCHRESRLEGEGDIFLEDDVWKKLRNI